jgi:anaerobic magnesium-protoporphyrin IX monomethyl ester cyclase
MRVLLVQAFTALDMELVYPLGLAYLAAHLGSEHAVEIFDLNLHRERPFEALTRRLLTFRPDVVGISLRNMKVASPGKSADDFAPQRETVEHVRRVLPGVVVVGGGTAFSLYADAMMRRLPLDLGVWGEAEERFPRLLENLATPWKVPGVYYREGSEVLWSGAAPTVEFASLRRPRRDLVDHAPYVRSSIVSVGVQAKRGCALQCIHCSDTFLVGHKVRQRAAREVVDEIEELVSDHGVEQFFFCDQIFNIPVRHAIDLCREIVDRGMEVRWSAWFNEHRNTLPDELMGWLKKAGCDRLSFSPDHVDDRMLKTLDKNFRREDLHYTIEVARRHGMDVEYSFFLNAPGEDARSLLAILGFLIEARLRLGSHLRTFTLLMMQPIRIYPHTRLAEMARESGLVSADDDLIEGRYWNPGALRWAVDGLQRGARGLYATRQWWRGESPAVSP